MNWLIHIINKPRMEITMVDEMLVGLFVCVVIAGIFIFGKVIAFMMKEPK